MSLRRKYAGRSLALLAFAFVLTGVLVARLTAEEKKEDKSSVKKAVCVLTPTKGSKVAGVITFTEKDGATEVTGEITGLTPGEHAFHVHEFGDLSKDDGMGTGGHFNPDGKKHGGPHDEEHHVGDMGNLKADDSGKATVSITQKGMTLNGPSSVVGHGLIVHDKADDFKTQPTGNAGGRVAQGVIGVAK